MAGLETISPIDGSVVAARPYASDAEISGALERARRAQRAWRTTAIDVRAQLCHAMVDAFVKHGDAIAEEITLQMGRPIAASPGEVRGFEERAREMIALAPEALSRIEPSPKPGFTRFVQREALGVVLTIAPWNYPYLTAVNSIVPAVMAGNAVILRHSAQTPLCAERIADAFAHAGAPEGLFQVLHLDHDQTARLVESPEGPDFVAFTGSVGAGHAVQRSAATRFIGIGLELGGKDPAYVRADVDLEHAVGELVDGAFFNSGQSCCGIERIYVHESVHAAFVERYVERVAQYRLGDPRDAETTLGPCVHARAANFVRRQTRDAVAAGARAHLDPGSLSDGGEGSPYLAPQVLTGVDHGMRVMTEESFGPVVGIAPVANDDEAVRQMNDSEFGLTASVWTRDLEAGLALGQRVETGTWFVNRCDTLDPALAWTGVKDSGRGCTLSRVGYEALTRPKSFHARLPG